MAGRLLGAGAQWAAAISGQALGTWLGGTSQGHGCECSCHFETSPDEALIGLLKGQLDRALESLSIGCRVLAYYDRDDNYWHERYIIGKVTDTRFIVVTPHFDIYEEDFSESLALCLIGPRGGLPTKLNGHVLRLDMDRFRRNEARLLGEGRQLAKEIREERAGYRPGDEVGLRQPEVVLGDRGVCELTDGTALAVAKEGTLESTATPRATAEQDLRTLPVRYDARGIRGRDFTDAVDRMSSTAMPDWPIKGPRTTLWLVQQFRRLGQTPLQRHQWWRQTQNLTAADAGVDEHQFLSELLEMGAQTDQLNEGELAVYETVARRYQLWEEIYANRLREHESGALRSSGSSAWLDEREIFLGQERGRGGALVCPELQTWVAERLQAEAAVLKERRKGREEKILARGKWLGRPPAPERSTIFKGRRRVGAMFSDEDVGGRHRDLLPIPVGAELRSLLSGEGAWGTSPSAKRRSATRRRQDQWLLEGIASLNELGGQGRQVPSHAPLTAAQRVAVRRLASLYGKWSPPVDRPSPHAAWSLLQGLRPGYSEAEAAGARTVYQRGNISLPKIGAGKVPLVDVLPADLQSKLESGRGLLRSPEEAAALIRDAGAPRAMDPKLGRLGYDYGHALGELFASGVIECSSEPVLEEAGMFFVARKDKRLRLICDTRTPNMHFTVPNHTALATGEALSSLEASGVNFIGMSSGDVDCCFYQYSLPPWCRRYFNLPTIQSRFLPLEVRNACGLSGKSGQVRFRFKVVPMGWNWAVHFIQEAHLHIVKSVLPSQPWCVDKHPGIDLSVEDAKVLYIDNFAVLSASPQRAAQAAYDMKAALAAKGVVSELDPQASEVGELLGCELDLRTGCWQVSGRRLWRLYGALEHLLSRRVKVSGQELERLIGHIVAAFMLRREGLALLHSSYEFVQASYTKRQPLWKSVLRELGWVKALLPCLRSDTRRPWSELVTCFDASPWGYGVVETEWDLGDVQRVGRVSERARFRGVLATEGAPRERAFEHEVACAPDPALLLVGRATRFPEVSHSTLQSRTWRVVGCGRWKRKEAIHGLEGAALTWAVRRAGRDARQHGARRLFLGDNMSLTLAAAKGRAANHRLLGVCRVLLAVGIAADLKIQVRWIPSEWNPSDAPSRRFQPKPRGPDGVPAAADAGRDGGGDAAGKAADAGEPSEAAPPPLRPSRAELAQEPFALQPHGGAPDGAAAAGQWQPPYGSPAGAGAVALTSSPGPRGRRPGAGWAKEQARRGWAARKADLDQRRRRLCPRQTRLAAAKVRFATQQLYLGAVLGLVRWLCLGCLPDWSRQTWDETLAEYIESIYDRGGSKASTQRLAPALLWAEPHLHTAGIREVFPLTHQTLRGWGVLEPSKSRPPVPYLVMLAAATWLCQAGKPLSALAIVIMFETYMRPSEVLALRARQVVLPLPEEGGASAFLTFVVRASEYEVPTKTNEYDLSVPLDLQRQQWLVKPISFVQALREPDALFLGLSYTELAEDFQSAIEALDVGVLRPTLYSLRHGGASQDRSMGVRSLGGVQQRGGWKTFKSVLRYEKHGRLSLELRKLSSRQREALRARGRDCALAFNKSLVLHFAPHRTSPVYA
ncbi:unnamed protein product [Prorocentrum cordatum]|uniref:Tyr recombinase domain-containing protein n=1 Tax=Prorocentrum cordatum TaxID=2364126 RepID=A0ABN9T7Z9_9DINO|nr:unnamed protein product [Polarella glacialis]